MDTVPSIEEGAEPYIPEENVKIVNQSPQQAPYYLQPEFMIPQMTSEEKIDADFFSAIRKEEDTGVVKALFRESSRKLKVKKTLGKYEIEDLIQVKNSPIKYSYSSGEENFDEDCDEENEINEVYSHSL